MASCTFNRIITVEEGVLAGGFGSAVLETANRLGLPADVITRLGLAAERFYQHGSRAGQLAEAGIDAAGICTAVRRIVRAARGAAEGALAEDASRTDGQA